MQLTASTAEKLIAELGMPDMPLIEVRPISTSLSPEWFGEYKNLCRRFMLSLTDSVDTLAMMDIPQDEFMNLIMGRTLPDNLSFRFRIPLTWGGRMEISNMFMCRTFPHSYNMDRFILTQAGAQTIWLPDPAKKVYWPANVASGGEGGNGTEDRLTEQIASQIAADRDF